MRFWPQNTPLHRIPDRSATMRIAEEVDESPADGMRHDLARATDGSRLPAGPGGSGRNPPTDQASSIQRSFSRASWQLVKQQHCFGARLLLLRLPAPATSSLTRPQPAACAAEVKTLPRVAEG